VVLFGRNVERGTAACAACRARVPGAQVNFVVVDAVDPVAAAVAFSAPAIVTPTHAKTPSIRDVRRPTPSPRRIVVWSDQRQGLVTVDSRSKPIDPAPEPTISPALEVTDH